MSSKSLRSEFKSNPERVILAALIAVGLHFFAGYLLMIGMDWLHGIDGRIPDLGYLTVMAVVLVWRCVGVAYPSRPS